MPAWIVQRVIKPVARMSCCLVSYHGVGPVPRLSRHDKMLCIWHTFFMEEFTCRARPRLVGFWNFADLEFEALTRMKFLLSWGLPMPRSICAISLLLNRIELFRS